jgi:hypothetical protein
MCNELVSDLQNMSIQDLFELYLVFYRTPQRNNIRTELRNYMRLCELVLESRDDLVEFVNLSNVDDRIVVSLCINNKHLPKMMNDKDWRIRRYVTDRIDASFLPQMMNDPDICVRRYVAHRIEEKYLPEMLRDFNYSVRKMVAKRIDKETASLIWALDEDKRVREAAKKNVLGQKQDEW